MNTVIHRNQTRGYAHHGWLKSHHTFSFADYFRPDRMNFGTLRVLNDDNVEPGQGFLTHGHKDMEIVSIPLSGALRHKDSTGREAVIRAGEVQIMSAGSGIKHSEMNASATEPVSFLQVWILPKQLGIEPRYQQAEFPEEERRGRFRTVVSPSREEGSLWINQDAYFSLAEIAAGSGAFYRARDARHGLYLFVIEGEVSAGGETLGRRDAMGLEGREEFLVRASKDATVLLIEVSMEPG